MRLSFVLIILLTFGLSACSHRTVKRSDAPTSNPTEVGPPTPTPSDQAYEQPIGPEALPGPEMPDGYSAPQEKPGYVLVLGPGLARAGAYIGALKEISESKLPINAIVGVEMGAVVGALYATRGINAVEWYFDKLSEKTFRDFPVIGFGPRIARGQNLEKFLDSAFQDKTFSDAKIPVYVITADEHQENIIVEKDGRLRDILRSAVSLPGVIKPNSSKKVAALLVNPWPVAFARSLGLGKVVAIDVLGSGVQNEPKFDDQNRIGDMMKTAANRGRSELHQADLVVEVKTSGAPYLDFSKRAELAYQGKVATKAKLKP